MSPDSPNFIGSIRKPAQLCASFIGFQWLRSDHPWWHHEYFQCQRSGDGKLHDELSLTSVAETAQILSLALVNRDNRCCCSLFGRPTGRKVNFNWPGLVRHFDQDLRLLVTYIMLCRSFRRHQLHLIFMPSEINWRFDRVDELFYSLSA